MALSIKSIEAERLAREIASKTGESLTTAIQKALEERLERLRNQRRSQILASQLDEILRRVDQLPLLDNRTEDEILGDEEISCCYHRCGKPAGIGRDRARNWNRARSSTR